ncbi:hypothetical protein RHMOL_Rhmol08G0077900 [Rhododendron molle]|uniref:Uncharacterized protein n=1 Tax=Rhododendron molle TaxID=49168 RepID=A0ACC0MKX8_RHOML|nr:hypothetical protein RHMOL_Rhmol08G0077900 [Rhododendron molle]
MEEKCENDDKMEDIPLPGFRFHPTDEELVGFYLKRKIQQRPLPIELIKQVDIYKYDPWDLPKLSSTGEKECYFYCPRDSKYRNSARPNRVTGAGFWKATGTDRPIYSSDGTKCIGLKKSLVFYRGKAAKGIKTDWMMHEFRLPSISHQSSPKKSTFDKIIPPSDSWAICRIFKKTNTMAHRTLSHSWVSPVTETTPHDVFTQGVHSASLSSESISCTSETGSTFQLCSNNGMHQVSTASFSAPDIPSYRPMNPTVYKSSPFTIPNEDLPDGFMVSPAEISAPTTKNTVDVASMVFNPLGGKTSENINFGGSQHFNGFFISSTQDIQGSIGTGEDEIGFGNNQWGNIRTVGLPFGLSTPNLPDTWKPTLPWDSPSYPSEMSTTYSEQCYT